MLQVLSCLGKGRAIASLNLSLSLFGSNNCCFYTNYFSFLSFVICWCRFKNLMTVYQAPFTLHVWTCFSYSLLPQAIHFDALIVLLTVCLLSSAPGFIHAQSPWRLNWEHSRGGLGVGGFSVLTFPTHRPFRSHISFYLQSAPASGKAENTRWEQESERKRGGMVGVEERHSRSGMPFSQADSGRSQRMKRWK